MVAPVSSYSYTAYGLGIQSEFSIPEFLETTTESDIIIKYGRQYTVPPAFANQWTGVNVDDDKVQFFVNGHGLFYIDNVREITVHVAPNADKNLLRRFLIGTVMALVLQRRKHLVLHGSAVAVDGKAIAFLGRSGQGKSSIAAALLARGHTLISDDVIAISLIDGQAKIAPAYPELKVDPKVAQTLSLDSQHLYSIFDGTELGFRNLNQFTTKPVALDKIFILTVGDNPKIEPIPAKETVMELISNSYVRRKAESDSHLIQCAQLSKAVPVRRLFRGNSLNSLTDLAYLAEQG